MRTKQFPGKHPSHKHNVVTLWKRCENQTDPRLWVYSVTSVSSSSESTHLGQPRENIMTGRLAHPSQHPTGLVLRGKTTRRKLSRCQPEGPVKYTPVDQWEGALTSKLNIYKKLCPSGRVIRGYFIIRMCLRVNPLASVKLGKFPKKERKLSTPLAPCSGGDSTP